MRCVDFVTDPASDDAMDLAFNKKGVTTASGGW
jgi:hypothetical protein